MYIAWTLFIISIILTVSVTVVAFYYLKKSDKKAIFLAIIATILLIISIFCCFLSVKSAIVAKREYVEFNEMRQIVEQAYDNGSTFENTSTTATVIELNKWVAKVRADKAVHGKWSIYYFIDENELQPIVLGDNDE